MQIEDLLSALNILRISLALIVVGMYWKYAKNVIHGIASAKVNLISGSDLMLFTIWFAAFAVAMEQIFFLVVFDPIEKYSILQVLNKIWLSASMFGFIYLHDLALNGKVNTRKYICIGVSIYVTALTVVYFIRRIL